MDKQTETISYPILRAPRFGTVLVGDEAWERDFFIRADGKVKRRDKKRAKELYGSSHVVGPEELAQVAKKGARAVIVATGYGGVVTVAPLALEYARQHDLHVKACPTPEAVEEYARTEGPKAILVHVTC